MKVNPIGFIKSPYKQKFAIPRQAGLVGEAQGEIHFTPTFSDPNFLRGIEQFSHLWLLFIFHETADKGWSPLVQPPRLGGKTNVGVFATRSTFRPNAIGMSVVENLGWRQNGNKLSLRVGGLDLLDATPIIDIKPYLPYADALPSARAGFAESPPATDHAVTFSAEALQAVELLEQEYPQLQALISGVLQQDPRPAWRKKAGDSKQYGMHLHDLNIKWLLDDEQIRVVLVERNSGMDQD